MSQAAMDYLTDRVADALSYCAREFDMTVGEAVGTLHIAAAILLEEHLTGKSEDIPEEWR